jgi:hypothetical protein
MKRGKVKKINVTRFLNKQTIRLVASMWRSLGYKVIFRQ